MNGPLPTELKFRENTVPVIAVIRKSPCFRGNRDSIKFGTFATKETVRNIEVPMTRTMP